MILTSCNDQEVISTSSVVSQAGEGYQFTVTIPEPIVATRAMGHELTSIDGKPMHVLVFDENGFFVANQTATSVSYDSEANKGTYSVSLPPSDRPRILHFVLGNVRYDTYVPDDSEASIFSSLSVSDNEDAYWQRIEVDKITKDEQTGEITSDFPELITLVRNFAQISVESEANNFRMNGFAIVDARNAGTVAPYTGSGFATFDLDLAQDENPYNKFVSLNKGFGGTNAGDIPETPESSFTFTPDDKYVYERNQDESDNPAYILVKGYYDGSSTPSYYKLDIVSTNDRYVTSYLNLYRNFHYTIQIDNVAGAGYSSITDAMNAVASNNLSASVEVSQVNRLDDGNGNELWVSDMDIMLVSSEPHTINYTYTTNNGNEGNANAQVMVTPSESGGQEDYNHAAVHSIVNDGNGNITITPVSPLPATIQTQEFVVSTPSHLSRRVTVHVRQAFVFEAVDCDELVENVIGSGLTLIVQLPENMPTAVFPLELNIEPDKKSIYPDVSMNRIPVEEVGNYTFKYQATVTYNEYRQNPTLFFHFKTNMTQSATSIKVTNDYFENTNNIAIFENAGTDEIFNFGSVTLNGDEGTYYCESSQNKGETITLGFDLHNNTYQPPTEHTIEIFGNYLEVVSSSTGTCELRKGKDNAFIYVPNDIYERQYVTFRITQDYASSTIQLSARDHKTATIDYTMPAVTVTLQYQYRYYGGTRTANVPEDTQIFIYKDAAHTELVTKEKQTNDYGQITMDTFVGFTGDDIIYFECEFRPTQGNRGTYSGSARVSELAANSSFTLTLNRQ
ncbi:hypothetical protein B5F25_13300 [Bacteroides sp. An19]|nr:hypothetical protein B5F25_13300 [Bacteroides sp. An19]